MSTVQRIGRNTGVLILANIASLVLGFFFTMYVARYLGAEGFGVLSFALAFTAIFGVFTDIGLQTFMIREIARDKALAQKYLSNIAVLKIFLVIVTFGLIALTINLLDYPEQTINVVYLMALSVIFNAFSTMFYGVFRAYERMEFEALGGVLSGALTLAGAFWAISHDYSVVGFASIYFIVSVITLGYSFGVSAWKSIMPRVEIDLTFWKEALKQAWPFTLIALFGSIYYWIGILMLSSMKGQEAVGWYGAAYRLVLFLGIIPMVYLGSVFPVMSRYHNTSKELLEYIYKKSFKYLLILAVPIGAGTTILAQKIILSLFGIGYYPSIIVLQIVIWWCALAYLSGIFMQLFLSLNRQSIAAMLVVSYALINVIFNLILIPRYSYTGASIALVAAEFVILNAGFIWSSRIGYGISTKSLIEIIAKVSIASAVMSVFVMYFENFYILALIPLSALVYFAVLYIVRGIDKEDLLLLKSILNRSE